MCAPLKYPHWLGYLALVVLLAGCGPKGSSQPPKEVPETTQAAQAAQVDPLLEGIGDISTRDQSEATEKAQPAKTPPQKSSAPKSATSSVRDTMKGLAQHSEQLRNDPLLRGLESLEADFIGDLKPEDRELDALTKASRAFNERYQNRNAVDIWVLEPKQTEEDETERLTTEQIDRYLKEIMVSLEVLNKEVYTQVAMQKLGELTILTTEKEGLEQLQTKITAERDHIKRLKDLEMGALRLGIDFLAKQKMEREETLKLRDLNTIWKEQEEGLNALTAYYTALDIYVRFIFENWRHFWDGEDGKVLRADHLRRDYNTITDAIIDSRKEMEAKFSAAREQMVVMLSR